MELLLSLTSMQGKSANSKKNMDTVHDIENVPIFCFAIYSRAFFCFSINSNPLRHLAGTTHLVCASTLNGFFRILYMCEIFHNIYIYIFDIFL